jgi:hypothetical protein
MMARLRKAWWTWPIVGVLAGCTGAGPAASSSTPPTPSTLSSESLSLTQTDSNPLLTGAILIKELDGAGPSVINYAIPHGSSKILVRVSCVSGPYAVIGHGGRTLFNGTCSPRYADGGAAVPTQVGATLRLHVDARIRWKVGIWGLP